jgi:hypothetical protein
MSWLPDCLRCCCCAPEEVVAPPTPTIPPSTAFRKFKLQQVAAKREREIALGKAGEVQPTVTAAQVAEINQKIQENNVLASIADSGLITRD